MHSPLPYHPSYMLLECLHCFVLLQLLRTHSQLKLPNAVEVLNQLFFHLKSSQESSCMLLYSQNSQAHPSDQSHCDLTHG